MMREWLVIAAILPFGLQAAEPPPPAAVRSEGPAVDTSAPPPQGATSTETAIGEQPRVISRTNDRLQLDTTVVTGNRELPKVLYIVPWKKADLGDLPAQPFNTLLDEVLTPVDRDVFRREVTYYGVIADRAQTTTNTAEPSGDGSEK